MGIIIPSLPYRLSPTPGNIKFYNVNNFSSDLTEHSIIKILPNHEPTQTYAFTQLIDHIISMNIAKTREEPTKN